MRTPHNAVTEWLVELATQTLGANYRKAYRTCLTGRGYTVSS